MSLNLWSECVEIKPADRAAILHSVSHRSSQALSSNNIIENASREWTIYNSDVISPSGCQTVGGEAVHVLSSSSHVSINEEAETSCSSLIHSTFTLLWGESFLFSLSHVYMLHVLHASQRTVELSVFSNKVDIVIWVLGFSVALMFFFTSKQQKKIK